MSEELMKLYVPLRIHPDDGIVLYEEEAQVRVYTRPGAILAALDLVATFERLGRAVEVYVQDESQQWHRVSGRGRIKRPGVPVEPSSVLRPLSDGDGSG